MSQAGAGGGASLSGGAACGSGASCGVAGDCEVSGGEASGGATSPLAPAPQGGCQLSGPQAIGTQPLGSRPPLIGQPPTSSQLCDHQPSGPQAIGPQLPDSQPSLGPPLGSQPLIRRIVRLDEVGSTNSYARALATEGPFDGGIAVIADRQLAGRGRLGRGWVSRRGKSLAMSVLLRAEPGAGESALLTLVAACSAARAIGVACEGRAEPMIKWPNDIVCGGKKVCGILVEAGGIEGAAGVADDVADAAATAIAGTSGGASSGAGDSRAGGRSHLSEAGGGAIASTSAGGACFRYVIVGIGVNVNLDADDMPPELAESATSLKLACGRTADLDVGRLAEGILSAFSEDYRAFAGRGEGGGSVCAGADCGGSSGCAGVTGREDSSGSAVGAGSGGSADGEHGMSSAGGASGSCSAGRGRGTHGMSSASGSGGADFSEGSPLRAYYMARCVNIGRALTVVRPDGSFDATGVGISPEGHLIVELAGGERRELVSGEVSVRGICGYV